MGLLIRALVWMVVISVFTVAVLAFIFFHDAPVTGECVWWMKTCRELPGAR